MGQQTRETITNSTPKPCDFNKILQVLDTSRAQSLKRVKTTTELMDQESGEIATYNLSVDLLGHSINHRGVSAVIDLLNSAQKEGQLRINPVEAQER